MALEAFRLDGKAAIVTGASRGLGSAMALALAEAGADVALGARAEAELAETARGVERLGRKALILPTDVTAYEQVEALVERAVQGLGRLDILVNNAGTAGVRSFAEMAPEEFRRTIEVNLVGVFNGCRAAARRLIAQTSGKIINLASVLGAAGVPGYSAYSPSQRGVIALPQARGGEWARFTIHVKSRGPGWFVTDMNSEAFAAAHVA